MTSEFQRKHVENSNLNRKSIMHELKLQMLYTHFNAKEQPMKYSSKNIISSVNATIKES